MSTLAKRANGPQMRMLRIVTGAVLNTAHAHPNKLPDERFARGVAKRAVGTISSQWADLLATGDVPPSGKAPITCRNRRSRRKATNGDGGGSDSVAGRPISKFCANLGKMVKPFRMAGDTEAANAVIAAISALAPLARREQGKSQIKAAEDGLT